jgi:hypothetical protein
MVIRWQGNLGTTTRSSFPTRFIEPMVRGYLESWRFVSMTPSNARQLDVHARGQENGARPTRYDHVRPPLRRILEISGIAAERAG